MTELNELEQLMQSLDLQEHESAWETPLICRVEVDLPGWMAQLTGNDWEVVDEDEAETCVSFAMRQKNAQPEKTADDKLAEITLYHNGYAVVNVDGKSLFDGSLTKGATDFAHLSYYNGENGEPVLLN